MNYRNALVNFFGTAATAVKAKLAQLNPINRFIKFSLEQIFQQLIKDQKISYESLVSGIIELPNLELDTQKINNKYLFTSPYTLNSGKIGHLKIILPSFTQMDTQNIQVEIKQIQLELNPIQNFEENFKKIMNEIQQFLYHFVGEQTTQQFLVEKGPQDYFKETLRELLANIKIRVENIVVMAHLQKQDPEAKMKPDILFRIPLINIHRGADTIKEQKNKFEEINFDCQIPQLTLHLMDSKQQIKQGFPFSYPQPDDASTALLFGAKDFKEIEIETAQNIPRLSISICKSIEKAEKKTKLSFKFPSIELMFDPSQIKTLILFAKQINEFSHRLISVKKQLGLGNQQGTQVLVPTMEKKQSTDKKNVSMYTSMSMSFLQSSVLNFSKVVPKVVNNDIFTSIIEKNKMSKGDLFQSINQFYDVMGQSSNQNQTFNAERQTLIEQLQMINFKESIEVKAQIGLITLCVQKYNLSKDVKNNFAKGENLVNSRLPNSYFGLTIKKVLFHLKENKETKLQISEIKLDHVKYLKEKQTEQKKTTQIKKQEKKEDESRNLKDSMHLYAEAFFSMEEQKLTEHFCIEEIIHISGSYSESKKSQFVKRHNFLSDLKSNSENHLYNAGFVFNSYPPCSTHNLHKYPVNKLEIMDISLALNSQILKQLFDIYFIVEKELSIIQKQNQQNTQNNTSNNQKKEKKTEEKDKNKSNQVILLQIRQLNLAFFDINLDNFTTSVQKYMNDQIQTFQRCFCKTNSHGIYIKLQTVDLRKNNDHTKLTLSTLELGMIHIQQCSVSRIKPILSMKKTLHEKQVERCFQLIRLLDKKAKSTKLSVICPEINLEINQTQPLQFLEVVHQQLQSFKQQIVKFIEISKKNKKDKPKQEEFQNKIQLFVERFQIKFLNIQVAIQNICLFKQDSQLLIKLNTFILAIRDEIEFYASKMVNQKLCLIHYSQPQKYSGIKESKIALQFGIKSNDQFKLAQQNLSDFLEKAFKIKTSLNLTVKNSSARISKFTNSQSQKMALNQSKEIKEAIKTYQLNLTTPIYANAIVFCLIANEKQKYECFVNKIKPSAQKLIQLINDIVPSDQQQKTQQKLENSQISQPNQLIVSSGKIVIDIRPTFIQFEVKKISDYQKLKKQPKKVVFSNSRSFLILSWQKLSIFAKSKKMYIEGTFNLNYKFMKPEVTIQQEPISISEEKLQTSGFEEILKMEKIHVIVQTIQTRPVKRGNIISENAQEIFFQAHDNISKKIRLNVGFKLIEYSSDLQALAWLGLHWKHFVSHNVKRNFGLTLQEYEDQTAELKAENFDFSEKKDEVVNLNNGAQIYTEKDKRKKQFENSFLGKSFTQPELDEKCEFYVQTFGIEEIKFKLINKFQTETSIQINVKELNLSAKIPNLSNVSMELFGKINELRIVHENKQPEYVGFTGWISNKFDFNSYGKFTVLENQGQLKFRLEKDLNRTYLKFDHCNLNIGFDSVILKLSSAYQAFKKEIDESGWKKVYEEQIRSQKSDKTKDKPLTLISIPQNTIYVSLIYECCSILQNQKVEAPQFLMHEESDKLYKINEFIVGWVKSLLLNNVSGLVGGFLMDKFNFAVSQIVQLISFLLSCIF